MFSLFRVKGCEKHLSHEFTHSFFFSNQMLQKPVFVETNKYMEFVMNRHGSIYFTLSSFLDMLFYFDFTSMKL